MARLKNDGKGRLGGRKAGTPNKATATTREWIQALLDENQDSIREDLRKMSAKDRVTALLSLIPYVTPKQMATTSNVTLERLGDEQINELAEQILNGMSYEDSVE